jgi:hypothetical protein
MILRKYKRSPTQELKRSNHFGSEELDFDFKISQIAVPKDSLILGSIRTEKSQTKEPQNSGILNPFSDEVDKNF